LQPTLSDEFCQDGIPGMKQGGAFIRKLSNKPELPDAAKSA